MKTITHRQLRINRRAAYQLTITLLRITVILVVATYNRNEIIEHGTTWLSGSVVFLCLGALVVLSINVIDVSKKLANIEVTYA